MRYLIGKETVGYERRNEGGRKVGRRQWYMGETVGYGRRKENSKQERKEGVIDGGSEYVGKDEGRNEDRNKPRKDGEKKHPS